jgi:hypothetical protein
MSGFFLRERRRALRPSTVLESVAGSHVVTFPSKRCDGSWREKRSGLMAK